VSRQGPKFKIHYKKFILAEAPKKKCSSDT